MPSVGNSGMQTFLRMAGLFGPQDDTEAYEGMPSDLRGTPPLVNRQPDAGVSVPGAYGSSRPTPSYGNQASSEEEDGSPILEAFKQNVLNPPQRKQMTYPKNTLAGLHKALEIAAEPSPLEKNRVWVNGKPHQKQTVRTDPVTGEKQFITNVHEPSFGSQVMRAMPASMSAATDILNQPHEDAMGDWEVKNKGLAAAANAESATALARQRNANAGAVQPKLDQNQQKIDISKMTADERARASRLNTLTDAEKIQLVQEGKVSVVELQAAAAMARTVQSGQDSMGRTIQSGRDAMARTVRTGENQLDTQALRGEQALEQIGARGDESLEQIGARTAATTGHITQRGDEARKTKLTPSGASSGASSTHTQQKQAAINKAAEVINAHPEWADRITKDPTTGMPVISPPSDPWFGEPDYAEYDKIYEALYGRKRGSGAVTAPAAKPPVKPAGKSTSAVVPPPASQPPIKQYSASRDMTRISTDGGKTWKTVKGRQ